MPARFFVDENDLGLGRALEAKRGGHVVYPGHPALPEVARGSDDDTWLPVVGAHGLVVITRDKRIRYRLVEKRMWVDYHVRGVVLTGRRSQSTVDSLGILEKHWLGIERVIAARPTGPWMYAVTDERLREIDLS